MFCKNCKYWTRRKYYWIKYEVIDWRDNKTVFIHDRYGLSPESPYNRYGLSPESPYKILEIKPFESKFGDCSHKKFIYTMAGGCVEDDDVKNQGSPDALLYTDGEAEGAYFMTGENFGCVHFSALTTTEN